ncbi:MAG: hypothetical protein RIS92_2705 [Verrucomicrobiota bacterium]
MFIVGFTFAAPVQLRRFEAGHARCLTEVGGLM